MNQIKALILNASLKSSDEESNTGYMAKEVAAILEKEEVETEILRLADYHIAYGIDTDMGNGDEWPQIYEKVKEADIVMIGTPLWIGEKSSLATVAMERLYGGSSDTNEKGQAVYYNKVGGVLVTGNEDGAKQAAASVLYGLSHIGFVIPPNVDAYWVGEAGPGASYIEAEGYKSEFTQSHIQMLAYNTLHLAKILKENPIPAKGNTM
ncbi:flavodoxin family protein [Jeotgalibacillus salarius]|uniref:Flavodoxin family protein n=1 Tax=Jeotgalibacillus salarius TaxID=546023 RepID=A0A4Y8LHE7_9BACL|nr:flavodoxin family protein [Jeotgalibacillus salarius]TFE00485.1 flavodoxin family protein [Jeotgalibacillus salarius]